MTTREEAIEILERGHGQIRRLVNQLPPHWLARHGLSGGTWSPKDLIGHLCQWEEFVLEALDAWEHGERAPIDREIFSRSINAINADGVRRRSRHPFARVQRDWDNAHGRLIRSIRTMSDARWERPATPRGRKALGHRIGQLLVGSAPFAHAEAHRKDLEEFVNAVPPEVRRV